MRILLLVILVFCGTAQAAPIDDTLKILDVLQKQVDDETAGWCRAVPDAREPKNHLFCDRFIGKTPEARAKAEKEHRAYLDAEVPRWLKAHGVKP